MPSPSLAAERAYPSRPARGVNEVRRARPLLGTVVEIRAAAPLADLRLHTAIDAAFAAVERVQKLMSYHDPASELSRMNRDAASSAQRVDAETYTVLQAALRFAALSDGAFDPCIGEQLEEWGYLPRSAPRAQGRRIPGGNWRDIHLLGSRQVRFGRPLRLDLGGIAKGYAVDRAVQALQRAGIENILVNAGGDLRVAGSWEQQVRLRHAHSPQLSADVRTVRNAALATSAAYYSRRRCWRGEVSPLLDPRSAIPYVESGSVSVHATDCLSADALTKVVLFATPQAAEQALGACGAYALVQAPPVANA